MQENLQGKAFPCVLHTIIPTETGSKAAVSCKVGAKMQEALPMGGRPREMPPTDGAIGGQVYNSEGARLSSAPRNSPSRLHVPFQGPYTIIKTINGASVRYRQVRGRGVVLKPNGKKRNGQKAEVEK